jgi:hypothetical protein
MRASLVSLVLCLAAAGSLCADDYDLIVEKPPSPWPNNLDVRREEPGCWQPPSDWFSKSAARRAVLRPFAAGLNSADRKFGAIPADVHVDGFVSMPLRLPRAHGKGRMATPCELSIVRIGPRKEKEGESDEPVIKTFLLLTSRGKTLWKETLAETPTGCPEEHYTLSRVVTQFEKDPFILLFSDFGGNSRGYFYDLHRVTPSGLQAVWHGDLDDGNSGSVQQGYGQSNFDFSPMSSGRANEFTAYTTSGCRRWMEPGDEEDLNPTYTKCVFRWDPDFDTFVTAAERSFHQKLSSSKRHPNETLASYDRAIKRSPDDSSAYHDRGFVKLVKSDAKGAVADFDRAIKLDPTDAQAYYFRGVAKKAVGDAQGAKADLARAVELDRTLVLDH